jgi:homospermidine synthase
VAHPAEHDIVDGIDELGVLLYGHAKNAYWYGSQLSIERPASSRLPERDRACR